MALSPDKSEFHILSTTSRWDTDSLYNDEEKPLSLETLLLRGNVTVD